MKYLLEMKAVLDCQDMMAYASFIDAKECLEMEAILFDMDIDGIVSPFRCHLKCGSIQFILTCYLVTIRLMENLSVSRTWQVIRLGQSRWMLPFLNRLRTWFNCFDLLILTLDL